VKLRTIFAKPVDRAIEGVIKADDTASLGLEVDEYVLTNEIEKRLEEFLEAYNHYEGANGAWISGFFGSGKSHLLKMISLLLGNEKVDGRPVADAFLQKSQDNAMLRAAIQKAVKIPSKSILFNIDQKADVISKSDVDALLAVFVKVFDESCGYYGKQPYIAQFERQLDEDGLLDAFMTAFESLEPKGWEWARSGRVHRFVSQVDQAYHAATGQSVEGIIDRFRGDYKLSIEDFAHQIDNYVRRHPDKDFRLNFFVDEVGQYIADNTKLMTNLQTIAESLATTSRGRAWVIVTAQEDMDSVVGEMKRQQGNDFSKIQARFANQMKLTSQDVAEVIQKRLLAKTDAGKPALAELYEQQANNFKTLFSFSDGSKQYRTYQHFEHFQDCYPFVPYQFDLFQLAIKSLSAHNAFTGKYSSVGERSMLGVFQQVAIHIADHAVGEIATFDLMFEGIRSALKSQLQTSIHTAEHHLSNDLAVRLLKALFLVKYVREFRPTIRNLCILMLDHFDADLRKLESAVQEALNLLENQVYVKRNGDEYEFLTDEEKDVEQEIKNTDVDSQDVAEELVKLVFDELLKVKKIRYEDTKHDYPFTRKLDDRIAGREYELAIHIISPFHDQSDRIDHLRMQAMGLAELLVVLPPDDRLMRDLTLYKQTEKYIKQNVSQAQQDSIKQILTNKTYTNKERLASIRDNLKEQLGLSRMFVANGEVESNSHEPVSRIHDGFNELVRHTYSNLRMLRGITYTEANIEQCLVHSDSSLFAGDPGTLGEAEMELLSYIGRNTNKGVRTTVKQLVEDFERKPFGWPLPAILCTLAKLCGRGKVEARAESQPLEDTALVNALKNTRLHGNVVLEPQIEFTSGQIRRVKEFFQDFFDQPARSTEAKSLAEELATGFDTLHRELAQLHAQASHYPFLVALEQPVQQLRLLASKSAKYFFTEFEAEGEKLLDLKESVLDPIRRFMSGPNAKIYDEAKTFLDNNESNIAYVDGNDASDLQAILTNPTCYAGDGMQRVKSQLDSLKRQVGERLHKYRRQAVERISKKVELIQSIPQYETLNESQKGEVQAAIAGTLSRIDANASIAFVKDAPNHFETNQYNDILRKIDSWLRPSSPPSSDRGREPSRSEPEYVSVNFIDLDFHRPWLSTEEDVDEYLAAMRRALIKQIIQGNRIQL
jgi:hypothetical protein